MEVGNKKRQPSQGIGCRSFVLFKGWVLSMLPVSTQEQLILDPAHVDWTLLGECPFIALSPNLHNFDSDIGIFFMVPDQYRVQIDNTAGTGDSNCKDTTAEILHVL